MSSELNLVTQLAIILISAGVFTVISKALKQPVILGYIIAGFIIAQSSLFPQFSPDSVNDPNSGPVHDWSELGIIFLLFGLGLEFNFKKLLKVGSAAIITALTICLGMFILGYITGSALHWSSIESIFLGGMMGMSSTTIIIKAYDDLGIKDKSYASLVFGLLVVEDLLAVLLMVFFSTIAVSDKFSGVDMLLALAKLVTFLVISFIAGIYVIPSLIKKTEKFITDEILLLISVGLCFAMVVFANAAGFSSALGAFLMGSILSSITIGERAEKLVGDLKNLFGAIFFVSVGMMVRPEVIAAHWSVILLITVVAMVGILVFSTAGAIISGKDLDTAVHVGFSLPQLGEFSFIIAGLGISLGVISDYIYPMIISVSVITTFTTPYMIKAADPVSAWLHNALPENLVKRLQRRATKSMEMNRAEQSEWHHFFKLYFTRVSIYTMLLVVILIALGKYLPVLAGNIMPDIHGALLSAIEIATSLLVISPFVWGLAINRGELRKISDKLIKKDPRSRFPLFIAVAFRVALGGLFVMSAFLMYTKMSGWKIVVVLVSMVVIFIIARHYAKSNTKIEDRFMSNFKEKDERLRRQKPVATVFQKCFAGQDIKTLEVTIKPEFSFIGLPLREMPFRHNSGVNIVKIQRGAESILIPAGNEKIYPGDTLVAVGTNEQLAAFKKIVEDSNAVFKPVTEEFVVESILLDGDSHLTGMELKDTNLRAAGVLLVNVERAGAVITNPHKDFRFMAGDLIWLAGLKSSLDWFKK